MAPAVPMRRYERRDAVVFRKTNEEFGGLSNMARGFPLRVNGIDIRTSEALYQACRFPHLPDVQRVIIAQKSPMTAKMKSKPYRSRSRGDWEVIRVDIMRWCLRVKLAANWTKFRDLLLATNDRVIVEESGRDDFWGAKVRRDGLLVGVNALGRLLMELREELRGPSSEAFRRVKPLKLADFRLYGESIRVVRPAHTTAREEFYTLAGADRANTYVNDQVETASRREPTLGLRGTPTDVRAASGDGDVVSARPYPTRLIEVDLPIRKISAHARREKSIRHGHISTLHIWWARRPLAACRAVLLAALWPDPADPTCPSRFRVEATAVMKKWRNVRGGPHRDWNDVTAVRAALLDFIGEFANWNNATNAAHLDTARHLVQVAHESMGDGSGKKPLVVDPFAGGGAIPLEALRVGANTFASDLNPVAVLLNKVVLEYIPRHGSRLAEEVRRWGTWVREQAETELSRFYPRDPDGAVPVAYLWSRTISCEGPGCGAVVPLVRSLWLSKRRGRSVGMRLVPRKDRSGVEVELVEAPAVTEANQGTVRRGSATCPCCGYTTPVASVRTQLKARRGGASDAKLLCVVTSRPGQRGRFYRLPVPDDLEAWSAAGEELARREAGWKGALSLVPDEHLPIMSGVFNAPIYGHDTWGSLFTARQAVALTTLVRLVRLAGERLREKYDPGLAEAVTTCLALVVDRQADKASSLARWDTSRDNIANTFGRQALPMVWDFAEANPLSGAGGDWGNALDWVVRVCKANVATSTAPGHVQLDSATAHSLPDDAAHAFVTDPPYYNAVPYADLSDFFYVWLRRTLRETYPTLLSEVLSPKSNEICEMAGWDAERYPEKDGAWFEAQMKQAMAEGRRILAPSGIGVVVFAHKSTAGWEAQLQAMIDAGWIVTASWPIDTEMGSRLRAINSAALASSVHLVCRPRERPDGSLHDDAVGDWRAVLRELPRRIHAWMPRLAKEGVVGADAIFACLGPALEIFSSYSRVEKVSGERVELPEYLEQVWAAVAREALSMVFEDADATGLEADARVTAMWLWTLSTSTKSGTGVVGKGKMNSRTRQGDARSTSKPSPTFSLEFDAARKIAQGLGAHLDDLRRVVEIRGARARLLSVTERTRHLFGKDQARLAPSSRTKKTKQLTLFEELEAAEREADWGDIGVPPLGETTLDRVHQTMVLFAAGRTQALKRFLVEEGVGRPGTFWKLAQSLSALYPSGTDEKRWVDGVLARKKGLGF